MPVCNSLHDFFKDQYDDQVINFRVNGDEADDIANFYNVPSYPYFVHIGPNSTG